MRHAPKQLLTLRATALESLISISEFVVKHRPDPPIATHTSEDSHSPYDLLIALSTVTQHADSKTNALRRPRQVDTWWRRRLTSDVLSSDGRTFSEELTRTSADYGWITSPSERLR